ncbi:hypothetical protein SAMN04487989_1027 [Bizionia echini]|uniref:Outer membrane protein beta-barrel domain-containing protein n=1 Tax=Bizionia echini TaxID=649333 RepID=A0A1I5AFC0_9FLAO|nr:hypothetical protein [Bizionia echini]SFN61133.1 hypothetical protein SAMN04487989_1027 [Bizionia echini]
MRKIILSIPLLFGFFAVAQSQDSERSNTLYIEASTSAASNIGLTYEMVHTNKSQKKFYANSKGSIIYRIHYMGSTLESSNSWIKDVDGSGFGAEIGSRTYFNKKAASKGFFLGSNLTYGKLDFDKKDISRVPGSNLDFEGTYTYFSFFSPEVGYKILIVDKIAINLHVGTSWLIEVKGKGDIDNKAFDNWVLRAGLAIGYSF